MNTNVDIITGKKRESEPLYAFLDGEELRNVFVLCRGSKQGFDQEVDKILEFCCLSANPSSPPLCSLPENQRRAEEILRRARLFLYLNNVGALQTIVQSAGYRALPENEKVIQITSFQAFGFKTVTAVSVPFLCFAAFTGRERCGMVLNHTAQPQGQGHPLQLTLTGMGLNDISVLTGILLSNCLSLNVIQRVYEQLVSVSSVVDRSVLWRESLLLCAAVNKSRRVVDWALVTARETVTADVHQRETLSLDRKSATIWMELNHALRGALEVGLGLVAVPFPGAVHPGLSLEAVHLMLHKFLPHWREALGRHRSGWNGAFAAAMGQAVESLKRDSLLNLFLRTDGHMREDNRLPGSCAGAFERQPRTSERCLPHEGRRRKQRRLSGFCSRNSHGTLSPSRGRCSTLEGLHRWEVTRQGFSLALSGGASLRIF